MLLTRSPLIPTRRWFTVRLACVKHAASVRPEPGSNSPLMFKPQQPEGRREKQTPKGRFQLSRTSQTDSILVQPKKNSLTKAARRPPHKTRSNLASIFGTLLSSQGSDAHPPSTVRRSIGATVKTYSARSAQSNPPRSVDQGPRSVDQGYVLQGSAVWAVDDSSIDLRPP